jgi:hypothetical protein
LAAGDLVRALGWIPGTRLEVTERSGLLVLGEAGTGRLVVTGRWHVSLPAGIRRWHGTGIGLVVRVDPFWIAQTLVAALVLAEIAKGVVMLALYPARRPTMVKPTQVTKRISQLRSAVGTARASWATRLA